MKHKGKESQQEMLELPRGFSMIFLLWMSGSYSVVRERILDEARLKRTSLE